MEMLNTDPPRICNELLDCREQPRVLYDGSISIQTAAIRADKFCNKLLERLKISTPGSLFFFTHMKPSVNKRGKVIAITDFTVNRFLICPQGKPRKNIGFGKILVIKIHRPYAASNEPLYPQELHLGFGSLITLKRTPHYRLLSFPGWI